MKIIDVEDVRRRLYLRRIEIGGLSLSREAGCSEPFLSMVISGQKKPNEALCRAVGVVRHVVNRTTYEDVSDDGHGSDHNGS